MVVLYFSGDGGGCGKGCQRGVTVGGGKHAIPVVSHCWEQTRLEMLA